MQTNRHPIRRLNKRPAGFSLVESVLAVGILAFAGVGLLGLLPFGLGQMRSSIDNNVGAQLAQRVITDAEQTDFQRLLDGAETVTPDFFVLPSRYFDEQGSEVISESGATPSTKQRSQIIYAVRIRGSMPGPADVAAAGPAFTSLPAADGKTRFRPRSSTFLFVQIAHRPGGLALPTDEQLRWSAGSAPMVSYSAVLARTGRTAEGGQ